MSTDAPPLDPPGRTQEPLVLEPQRVVQLREAALSRSYVSLGGRRTSSPHEFYRYPARFSPDFAATAILCFTAPGDTVLDPFVGGGTTAVEAMRLGRPSVVSDLNPLATFITAAKTSLLDAVSTRLVLRWLDDVAALRLNDQVVALDEWADAGYFKDIETPDTWRIRKLVALSMERLPSGDPTADRFCRCVVLRTAQWALDMRREVPPATEFKAVLADNGRAMLKVARTWALDIERPVATPTILEVGLPGLADALPSTTRSPRCVITSPPYPGVYVNYHRWKLRGRREIPAPYWIAGRQDGHGLAHYTMGARAEPTLRTYFSRLRLAYTDLAKALCSGTTIVQLVGFSDVGQQLPRYLEVMSQAGLTEFTVDGLATADDGRLWRDVPNRRWWAEAGAMKGTAPHTSQEVVLLHRLTNPPSEILEG